MHLNNPMPMDFIGRNQVIIYNIFILFNFDIVLFVCLFFVVEEKLILSFRWSSFDPH